MDQNITTLITIGLGLLICFFGFKIQKLVIILGCFFLGFNLTGQLCGNFIEAANTLLIVKVVVGILLASMGFKLEKLALCIAVAYLSFESVGILVNSYIKGFDSNMMLAIQLGISILLGILSMLLLKPIIILVTSVAGASLIKDAIPVFITLEPTILTALVIVLAVAGLIVQLKTT